jgi:hypothetical protein
MSDAAEQTRDSGLARPAAVSCSDEPPEIVMNSEAGVQHAVLGSYCFCRCADRGVNPRQITVVHPGDSVAFSMLGGKLIDNAACSANCEPQRLVAAPCDVVGGKLEPLPNDGHWTVDLKAGVYVVSIESAFERDDGAIGRTSGVLGLLVDGARPRTIIEPPWMTCMPVLDDSDAGR